MRVSIISVGSEILRGTLLDTNAQFYAQELHAIGGLVARVTQVPDELSSIVDALESSLSVSDVVIISGGLGPTEDDLTREAIIELTGESPQIDQETLSRIRARFHQRGDEMPQRNEKQAWRIPSARILPNDHGTAPGWIVGVRDSFVVALPGPPRENRPIWRDFVRPMLLSQFPQHSIVSRTVKTIGIGESTVADRIADLIELTWPEVATYAKQDGVHVTVTAAHPERVQAEAAVRAVTDQLLSMLPDHVYGFGNDSLAAAIVQPLAAAGVRLAIWEAGTAGGFLNLLLSDDESQEVVCDARVWSSPDDYAGRAVFDIRRFARHAARSSGLSTAAVVSISSESDCDTVADGTIDVALAHAGHVRSNSQVTTGTISEIRRRAVLVAGAFFWSELRRAAGVHSAIERPSRSSRT